MNERKESRQQHDRDTGTSNIIDDGPTDTYDRQRQQRYTSTTKAENTNEAASPAEPPTVSTEIMIQHQPQGNSNKRNTKQNTKESCSKYLSALLMNVAWQTGWTARDTDDDDNNRRNPQHSRRNIR